MTSGDNVTRAPSQARRWTLEPGGNIDGHGDTRIRKDSTWRLHEARSLKLLVRRPDPGARTQRISLQRTADGSLVMLDPARSGELRSVWQRCPPAPAFMETASD